MACDLKKMDKRYLWGHVSAAMLALTCHSVWCSMPEFPWIDDVLLALMIIACLRYMVLIGKVSRKDMQRSLFSAAILFGYLVLFWILDPYKEAAFIKLTLTVLVLYLFQRNCDEKCEEKSLLFYYTDMITIIAIVSLIFWFFASYLKIVQPTGYIVSSWKGNDDLYVQIPSFYGIYFETQKIDFLDLIRISRNSACFTEAPIASFHFCLALLIELYIRIRQDHKRIVILSMAIISTFATTGYIILLVALFLKYISLQKRRKITKLLIAWSIPIVLVMAVCMVSYLMRERLQSTSGNIRMDDIRAGFMAWLDSPMIGNGYGNKDSYQRYMSSFRSYNKGFSNSILQILAYGGIYLMFPYFIAIKDGIMRCISYKAWDKLIFILLFVFMFSITITTFTSLSIYIFIKISDRDFGKDRADRMSKDKRSRKYAFR